MRPDFAACWLLALAVAGTPMTVGAGEDPAPDTDAHLKAVETLVTAYQAEDRDTWNAQFYERVRGQQPDELWQSAGVLTQKFGKIEKTELAKWDADAKGAFVKVTFENATRELFVRMKDGKVRQLDYVPPAEDAH